MKVRLKIKHLVSTAVVLAGFLFVFNLLIEPMLESRFIDKQIVSGNTDEAKAAIIEKIESSRFNQLELIKEYMIEPQPFSERRVHYDVYIGSSMSSGSGSVSSSDRLFTLEEIEPYLRMYLKEAPTDGYFRRTVEILKTHYVSLGNIAKAESVIAESMEHFTYEDYNFHELQLMLIELAIDAEDYEKADLLIAEYKPTMNKQFTDAPLRLSNLIAEMLVQQEKYQEAYQFLVEEVSRQEDWHQELIEDMKEDERSVNGLSGSPYYNDLVRTRNQLERIIDESGSLATVVGRVVRSNGEPIANAGVFLRKENEVNRSIIEGDIQTATAPDGSFSFLGVLPDSYQIHVGFMFEQIDGWAWTVENDDWLDISAGETVEYPVEITPLIETIKPANYEVVRDQEVKFSWGSYPNAASYELTGNVIVNNGSMGFRILSGITENEVTIGVEDLYAKSGGVMFRGDDFTDVEPGSVLGFVNTEGTFSWSIRAYNDTGRLIGQSNGYRLREETMGSVPFFHLKARELTETDRAFLDDGNVEKALASYKKILDKDPNDLHSLRMVTRLIGIDYDSNGGALPYLLALAKQSPTEDTLFEIARHYYQQENWDEFYYWYQRHNKAADNKPNYYVKSFYAGSLMKQGQLEEARTIFYEVMEEDRSNRFIGLLLALELYIEADWSLADDLAVQYKERGYDSVNWPHVISRLQDQAPKRELKAALEFFFEGDKEELTDFVTKTQNQTITNFIELLDEVR